MSPSQALGVKLVNLLQRSGCCLVVRHLAWPNESGHQRCWLFVQGHFQVLCIYFAEKVEAFVHLVPKRKGRAPAPLRDSDLAQESLRAHQQKGKDKKL